MRHTCEKYRTRDVQSRTTMYILLYYVIKIYAETLLKQIPYYSDVHTKTNFHFEIYLNCENDFACI